MKKNTAPALKIGTLAALCGISRDALRFYEREGLLSSPPRTPAGHRIYDQAVVERVEFIREHQQLGFTLDDIRELLRIVKLPEPVASRELAARVRERVLKIDEEISSLQTFRHRLIGKLESGWSAKLGATEENK
jgi:DNA-binding transcriptional MerR regulator